jgi:leucyl-tRNA synthetase
VSTPEPFQRLFNQGYIQAYAYIDDRGVYVEAADVEQRDGGYFSGTTPVTRLYGKMGKSLRNAVTPDDIYRDYGADTLRLYEMFMGPLDQSRHWNTADIIGVHRFLQRLWRIVIDEDTGEVRVSSDPADDETRRLLHRTIAAVRDDMTTMSFNTAIAALFTLNNHLWRVVEERGAAPAEAVESLVLMVAPLAPHVAEELWERIGHTTSLTYVPYPAADPALLVDEEVEIPVQLNGKVRAHVHVAPDADEGTTEAAARSDARVGELLEGKTVRKVVVVPGRLVNFVVG